jgi:hypothetical protein
MSSDRPSLLKQLIGAVVGASIALLIYGGYKVTEPQLKALLVSPEVEQPSFQEPSEHAGRERLAQIAVRARQAAQDLLEQRDAELPHAAAFEVPWAEEVWEGGEETKEAEEASADAKALADKQEAEDHEEVKVSEDEVYKVPEVSEVTAPELPNSPFRLYTLTRFSLRARKCVRELR